MTSFGRPGISCCEADSTRFIDDLDSAESRSFFFSNAMPIHIPVLPNEVIEGLAIQPGDTIVDGTFGGGGHTRLILEHVGQEGNVIAADRDPAAIEIAQQDERFANVVLVNHNYADIPEILTSMGIEQVDGILLDLGLSSDQLADRERGFSYQSDGDLDLRFDPTKGEPAYRLIQRLSEKHIADLIYEFGEERYSRRIAAQIVKQRHVQELRTASQIAQLVRSTVPRSKHHAIDPATRTFQALRIAVNEELKWLSVALRRLPEHLKPGGRFVVISFHSLEDRLVKSAFRENEKLKQITKKPIRPTEIEISQNPRSRSSRLRIAEKI